MPKAPIPIHLQGREILEAPVAIPESLYARVDRAWRGRTPPTMRSWPAIPGSAGMSVPLPIPAALNPALLVPLAKADGTGMDGGAGALGATLDKALPQSCEDEAGGGSAKKAFEQHVLGAAKQVVQTAADIGMRKSFQEIAAANSAAAERLVTSRHSVELLEALRKARGLPAGAIGLTKSGKSIPEAPGVGKTRAEMYHGEHGRTGPVEDSEHRGWDADDHDDASHAYAHKAEALQNQMGLIERHGSARGYAQHAGKILAHQREQQYHEFHRDRKAAARAAR